MSVFRVDKKLDEKKSKAFASTPPMVFLSGLSNTMNNGLATLTTSQGWLMNTHSQPGHHTDKQSQSWVNTDWYSS